MVNLVILIASFLNSGSIFFNKYNIGIYFGYLLNNTTYMSMCQIALNRYFCYNKALIKPYFTYT
jgi:hypothetical protein